MSDKWTHLSDISGSDKLLQWFEGSPSFHDAEVLEVHLDRVKLSWIRIVTDYKPVIVTFRLKDIVDLELTDFSSQNVISDLALQKKDKGFRLILSPCFGIAGFIEAEGIEIEISPIG
jgi:hypothetical protein